MLGDDCWSDYELSISPILKETQLSVDISTKYDLSNAPYDCVVKVKYTTLISLDLINKFMKNSEL